jgi:MerR family transcriptional regulator, thiopeptide resistance regulator
MTVTHDTTAHPATAKASIVPILVYEDIEAAHDYLVETFGFTSGGIHRTDDGTVVHAEVRMGDAAVWLHRVTQEHEMASPKGSPMATGGLEVIVPDVEAHYARSVAAGASIDRPPTDQAYGLREYGTRDPENHRWWFSSPLG